MLLPYIGKASTLGRALRLRARVRLESGDPQGAACDLLTLFRFARHASEPPLLIGLLVGNSLDAMAIQLIARFLPQFDQASLKTLSDGIAALPPTHTTAEGIAMEKRIMLPRFRQKIETARAKGSKGMDELRDLCATLDAKGAKHNDSAGGWLANTTPETLLGWTDGVDRSYAELIRLAALPRAQFDSQIDTFDKQVQSEGATNPLYQSVIPVIRGVLTKEFVMQARQAMLAAALDAQRQDPTSVRPALAKARDPFGEGPFQCNDAPGGLELRSKLMDGKKPVILFVGVKDK